MVKGWSRYTWQDLQKINAKDTRTKTDSLKISGKITKSKKELIAPISIGAFVGNLVRLAKTEENGYFDLYNPDFLGENGKSLYFFIGEKNKEAYQVKINDAFLKMSEHLSQTILKESLITPSTFLNNSEMVIKGNEKAIRLKEVTIKSKTDNSFIYNRGMPGTNVCGDYVCLNNIFNCKNHVGHPQNTQPVLGRVYQGLIGAYKGCVELSKPSSDYTKISAIHYHKEFYLNDYKDPQEPAFFSTIYWNYGLMLKGNKEAELEFYTSDITGKFRIVVQGITNNDVIYGEHFFEVKPKVNP